MHLTEPFYAYVIDKKYRSATGKTEYKENLVTVIASFIERGTLSFAYSEKGKIDIADATDILYICSLKDDPCNYSLRQLGYSNEYIIEEVIKNNNDKILTPAKAGIRCVDREETYIKSLETENDIIVTKPKGRPHGKAKPKKG